MSYTQEICTILQTYVRKDFITLHKRGNQTLKLSLKHAAYLGYTDIFIPDSGGWMTYEPFAQKAKLTIHKIKTNDGIIDPASLVLTDKSIVLYHSLGGYYRKQDTEKIAKVCREAGALCIEDACGQPTVETYGTVVVGSFGNAKPINFGTGGFAATNDPKWAEFFAEHAIQIEEPDLLEKVKHADERISFLIKKREQLESVFEKEQIKTIADKTALVLIIPFTTEQQQEKITALLEKENIEYELCPRYIRSMQQAVSAEIKRL
ncbi:MAG: regulator of RNase E activity RraB [Candidatus Woesearchaeota archaeon]|jgi:regulator of RNase E activity RraB